MTRESHRRWDVGRGIAHGVKHTHFGLVCGDVPKSNGVASPFGTTAEAEF